ncbi:vacuolar protein sorting-associated protein 9A [Cinnamomum micranthum f. kanehirae]|uniref:Vacuolar protein sorting-associated protein 9A n=1 Tax=Cinnamomum micranthum f. kanehirae TaxID=337451 RepID=A0A3S3NLR2_9MAGN|nr:vacuolar protein sorting-associated protein 9A [Cinnamomum micranthum f. kanehirae]
MENADVFGSSTAPLTWHDFLERMRHPSAAEFVKSIKSFIVSFSNHAPDPDRDSAAVQEFLANMERAFRAHSLWAGCSEEELDSAGEGLEKYVMTKLFTRAFASLTEDVKRDEQLSEKMALVQQFIRPENLDIKPSLQNETSWLLAQKELQKINMYKAPRDKLVCILNCCKVINNLLLNASIASNENPPGADEFLPVLIYANPPQLHSNLLYIQRYRRQSRLVSEAAYFFTNILSAESFIWSINAKSLSMDENEFEGNMESARAVLSGMSTNLETLLSQSNQDIGRLSTPDPKEPKPQPLKAKKERHDSHLPSRASSLKDEIKYPDEQENQSMARKPSISDLEYKGASELLKEDGSSSFLQEFPFLYANVGDLTLNEVEELLNSYKQLVIKYVSLSKGMGIHPPPLYVPAMQTESKTNNEPENTTEMKVSNEKDEDIKKIDGKSDATPDIDVGNLELKLPQQPPDEPVTISGEEKEVFQ